MWSPIAFVAKSRHVDVEALTAFALENEDKYGIDVTNLGPEVNNWHVDKLVADFKALPVAESQPMIPSKIFEMARKIGTEEDVNFIQDLAVK